MKKFALVLLLLGLMTVWGTQAMAVDLLVSGEYYAAGMYQDKTTLKKDVGPSTAFYFQRLRLDAGFLVDSGLQLFTRFDVMERAWGATRTAPADGPGSLQGFASNVSSAGTVAENENIAFDLAYVSYTSPIGKFTAGYQVDGAWGTVFGDSSIPCGKINYYNTDIPGLMLIGVIGKHSGLMTLSGVGGEQSYPRGDMGNSTRADADNNFYTAAAIYQYKTVNAGMLYKYVRLAAPRGVINAVVNLHTVVPYVKAQLGPVAIQAELYHTFGQYKYEEEGKADKRFEVLNAWIDAEADLGKVYVGGTFAFLTGQDPNNDAMKQGSIDGGYDWNPCLIMWNSDRTQWAGSLAGHAGTGATGTLDTTMANAYFFQVRGGVRPVDKLNVGMSITYANAVVKPTNAWLYNDYGWEVDLTATYNITNNLSYMLGGAYLFTGKYFKAEADTNEVKDNFLVINKLTLSF